MHGCGSTYEIGYMFYMVVQNTVKVLNDIELNCKLTNDCNG